MTSRQPRHIPELTDTICSACNLIIEIGDGRRYRMKYRHFHCLPETRLAKIDNGKSEASRTEKKYRQAMEIVEKEES